MCGIVGLLLKNGAPQEVLGGMLLPMFDCMAERGPDSAGLAVFGRPLEAPFRRYNLFAMQREFDWLGWLESFQSEVGGDARIEAVGNHAQLITALEPADFRAWLRRNDADGLHLLSVGRVIDVYKDQGNPAKIARDYAFGELSGTHAVGHTRMATESAVSPAHAHPFTAGEDFCLVHNGSLSNPYMLRRRLERAGLEFETDNDTEAACRFIEWRMQVGETLDEALETAFRSLDGFYTLLIATQQQLTLVRDAFACKPAVVAQTDDYVAVSSEFRSLAHLPGIGHAEIFEPLPERVYSWKV